MVFSCRMVLGMKQALRRFLFSALHIEFFAGKDMPHRHIGKQNNHIAVFSRFQAALSVCGITETYWGQGEHFINKAAVADWFDRYIVANAGGLFS